jgi:sulfite reductase (NADPH) flavoprotein alpha-component
MPGTIVFMLASFCMPLFAITGWLLYLQRRTLRSSTRAAQAEAHAR